MNTAAHVANLMKLKQLLIQEAALQDGVVAIELGAAGRYADGLSLQTQPPVS
jgi:hypothetical protein